MRVDGFADALGATVAELESALAPAAAAAAAIQN